MRWILDVIGIVVASLIVNAIWQIPESLHSPPVLAEPAMRPVPTYRPVPTSEPTRTIEPTRSSGPQVIYLFNLAPTRIWFDKADAVGYREAVLDGTPTRPYISLEKSRTVRGGRWLVLKQEDGLVMVKGKTDDIVGWIQ